MARLVVIPILAAIVVLAAACGDNSDEVTQTPTSSGSSAPTTGSPSTTSSSSPTPLNNSPSPAVADTATPELSDPVWTTYSDASGLSFPVPEGLTASEFSSDLELENGETVMVRTVSLKNAAGDLVLSLSVAPNPEQRAVLNWVERYPGSPGTSTEVPLVDTVGYLFEQDQVGDANVTVYFAAFYSVLGLRGKTGTTSGSGGPLPPTISSQDFDRVWQGIQVG